MSAGILTVRRMFLEEGTSMLNLTMITRDESTAMLKMSFPRCSADDER